MSKQVVAAYGPRSERVIRCLASSSLEQLLSRARRVLHAALDDRLASDDSLFPLELTAAQLLIVVTLAMGERVSVAELCDRVSYDAGAMTRMLDRLQSKGLIHRGRSTEDRRVVHVELTDEGGARLPRMREVSLQVLDQFLYDFADMEVGRLESYLARLLANAHTRLGVI